MTEDRDDHIVYIGRYAGKVMYIGEGRPERYRHLTSGVSNCYEANKHHFSGKRLQVEIVARGLTKQEARSKESELITQLNPEWNKPAFGLGGLSKNVIGKVKVQSGVEFAGKGVAMQRVRALIHFLLYKMRSDGSVIMHWSDIYKGTNELCDNKFLTRMPAGPSKQCKVIDKYMSVERVKGGVYKFTLTKEWMKFARRKNNKPVDNTPTGQ